MSILNQRLTGFTRYKSDHDDKWSWMNKQACLLSLGKALLSGVLLLGSGAALAGLDKDGLADVVFSNSNSNNTVCLGDGVGPFAACSAVDAAANNNSLGVALGFVDGDANLDAVFSNFGVTNKVCLGNGAGGFLACTNVDAAASNFSTDVALGFVDGDANLDAVFSNDLGGGLIQLNKVCLGNGAGGFLACTTVDAAANNQSLGVALGFVDGDANLDVVFSNNGLNKVCLGNGVGGFLACTNVDALLFSTSEGVALGFVDGDANLDAVFSNSALNKVCLGNGAGGFLACTTVDAAANNQSLGVALGFVDGDANLDAVFSNTAGATNQVCLGNGAGGFLACTSVDASTTDARNVALGFIDGDTNLDAVFSIGSLPNKVCLGNGDGTFATCTAVDNTLSNGTSDVAIAPAFVLPPADELEHYLSYKIKRSKRSEHFVKQTVTLEDQFHMNGPANYKIKWPFRLLTPTDKNDEGVQDDVIHYLAYGVRSKFKLKKHPKVLIKNQLHEDGLQLEVAKKARVLLVPTLKDLNAVITDPADLDASTKNHFLCYDVWRAHKAPRFRPTDVQVQDQFLENPKLIKLQKPVWLCNPVDKNGEGINNPDAERNHLLCYKAKHIKGQPRHVKRKGVHTLDQFGTLTHNTKREREFCVPSDKEVLPHVHKPHHGH